MIRPRDESRPLTGFNYSIKINDYYWPTAQKFFSSSGNKKVFIFVLARVVGSSPLSLILSVCQFLTNNLPSMSVYPKLALKLGGYYPKFSTR